MQRVKEIFEELQSTSSKTEKQRIIRENKNNELFKDTLVFLLSPYIRTGISNAKINKQVSKVRGFLADWNAVVDYLKIHNTGTDHDIAYIQGFISCQSIDIQEFYIGLVTKSIKLGCDAKVINAVIPNLIPTFDVMLANKYFDKPDRVKGEFTITQKLDGFRLATTIHNGEITFYSRQGQVVDGLVEIEEDLKDFLENSRMDNIFLDGELVAINCDKITSDENYKIVTKTARTKGVKHGLKYVVFDALPYDNFVSQKTSLSYYKRRWAINGYTSCIKGKHIEILPVLYQGSDTDMIMVELNKARKNHKEGIMINLNDGLYEFKRSNQLLKCKVMSDADLKIIDVYEGTGKNKGKLGGIVVEFAYNGNMYQCECGSGFDDNERVQYWNNPSEIVGKIATIQYFEISKNDNGGYGLRFPVWTHRIRDDKTEISMN